MAIERRGFLQAERPLDIEPKHLADLVAKPNDKPMLDPAVFCGVCGTAMFITKQGGWRHPELPVDVAVVSCMVCRRSWQTRRVRDWSAVELPYDDGSVQGEPCR